MRSARTEDRGLLCALAAMGGICTIGTTAKAERSGPDASRPIGILGGGMVVLPPSLGAERPYEIVDGHLDDLTALITIKNASTPPTRRLMHRRQIFHRSPVFRATSRGCAWAQQCTSTPCSTTT